MLKKSAFKKQAVGSFGPEKFSGLSRNGPQLPRVSYSSVVQHPIILRCDLKVMVRLLTGALGLSICRNPIRVETCNGPLCVGKQATEYSIC